MADAINKAGESALASALGSASSSSSSSVKKNNQTVSKDEFLMMLVTQLKNQDPMDPMKSDQFAVNLAQFSQLEQLISINDKMGTSGSSGSSSMATYLGQEVVYNAENIQVRDHDGGRVRFNLGSDASNVRVELLNSNGSVKETVDLGAVAAGKHSAVLSGLQTASGEYGVRVVATGLNGQESTINSNVAGIVTGFVPGADPILLVGDREVSQGDILEVNLPGTAA